MTTRPSISESPEEIRAIVREAYGRTAKSGSSCCGGTASKKLPIAPCCGGESTAPDPRVIASQIGYSQAEIDAVPDGANLGLGCGNPGAFASLRPGEVVVDLGAGAGFDALLAAQAVGPEGRVIGIDMTPEMLAKARTNAVSAGVAGTVEFREGIIEQMPVVDGTADVIISNCVINLSPDKPRVFREAFRVLKPGGRLAVSDIVLSAQLPEPVQKLAIAWVGCIAGAMLEKDYLGAIEAAGFVDVRATRTSLMPLLDGFRQDPTVQAAVAAMGERLVTEAAASVWSVKVEARKPPAGGGA